MRGSPARASTSDARVDAIYRSARPRLSHYSKTPRRPLAFGVFVIGGEACGRCVIRRSQQEYEIVWIRCRKMVKYYKWAFLNPIRMYFGEWDLFFNVFRLLEEPKRKLFAPHKAAQPESVGVKIPKPSFLNEWDLKIHIYQILTVQGGFLSGF